MRFNQGHGTIGTRDGDRKTGKSGAGADVRDPKSRNLGKRFGEKQRLAIMALDGLVEFLHARQIENFVPVAEQFVMPLQRGGLVVRKRGAAADEITKGGG